MKRLGIRPNHAYCTGEKGTRGIVFCSTQGATTDCDDISDMNKGNRPAINEDFDPDQSCLFDVFQLKCVPGSQQECPEGFGSAESEDCFPEHRDGCPEGYHGTDNDETAQCYPNSEPCPSGTLVTDIPHREYDKCAEMVVGVSFQKILFWQRSKPVL